MASKLYTEEQMRKTWNAAYTDALGMDEEDYKPKFFEDFIESLTPIELPNDEEILEKTKDFMFEKNKELFYNGAKWLRNKLTQNK